MTDYLMLKFAVNLIIIIMHNFFTLEKNSIMLYVIKEIPTKIIG